MVSRVFCRYYVDNLIKICKQDISIKKEYRLKKYSWKENNEKLYNNIIRARTTILDYCLCNNFKYFVTLTIKPIYNRHDLDWLRKRTNQIIRELRRKFDCPFKYILIPEQHKDGSWHLHGLFDSSFENDFYINCHGYLSWSSYDVIGFSSISVIDNYIATCRYITKYVHKDFEKREKTKHLYFQSNNLKRSYKFMDLIVHNIDESIDFNVINDFCAKIDCTEDEFIKYLDLFKKDILQVCQDDLKLC